MLCFNKTHQVTNVVCCWLYGHVLRFVVVHHLLLHNGGSLWMHPSVCQTNTRLILHTAKEQVQMATVHWTETGSDMHHNDQLGNGLRLFHTAVATSAANAVMNITCDAVNDVVEAQYTSTMTNYIPIEIIHWLTRYRQHQPYLLPPDSFVNRNENNSLKHTKCKNMYIKLR